MFSGIVQHTGTVSSIEPVSQGARLLIESPAFAAEVLSAAPLRLGDSICISGVCLTAVALEEGRALFDAASETLRKTTIGRWKKGDSCNIERSLRLGDSLDGHLVFGHVDGTTMIRRIDIEGETTRVELALPRALARFITTKGSVTLDGVSLTVGEVTDDSFAVYLIPHTREHTKFRTAHTGDEVNLEIDMIARYVARILEMR